MAYKIGELTLFDPEKRYEQLEIDAMGERYVIVDGDLLSEYTNITSIENWIKIGNFLGKDYKYIRERLQDYGEVNDLIWNTYTDKQKWDICIRKSTNNLQRRLTVLGDSYDYWMALFDDESYYCRKRRYQNAKSVLLRNVSQLNAYMIISIIKSDNLENDYINHGIEGLGLSTDPIEALYNFVDATSLSAYAPATENAFGQPIGKYETTGIRAMDLTMLPESTFTKSAMCDKILDILKTGNND